MERRFRRGEPILWRSVGADGTIGRAWPMTLVRDDDELIAVYLRPGTVFKMAFGMTRPAQARAAIAFDGRHYDAVWRAMDALVLYRPGDASSVWRYQRADDQTIQMWYVNLEEPWTRTEQGFDSRDHGLDVIVSPDLSSWSWKDEDEVEREVTAGQLTRAEVDSYRAEGERAAGRLIRREPPFDHDWTLWRPDPRGPSRSFRPRGTSFLPAGAARENSAPMRPWCAACSPATARSTANRVWLSVGRTTYVSGLASRLHGRETRSSTRRSADRQ